MSARATMRNTAARTLLLIWAFAVSQATEDKDASPRAPIFSCRGRSPGYYADLESGCQDYHMCDAGGRRYTYSCPNQTRFQQRVMICDHWFLVNCSQSESHFGANLLIGQKDRQFVEHFQQESGQNEERSYPARNRAFYAGPSKVERLNQSKTDNTIQPQGVYANEIKQALFSKSTPLQSPTKKSPEEKNSSVKTPDTNRYYSQFSTPTGSIKATTERSLSREFAKNPFFSSLIPADKGGEDSLTFLRGKDQAVSPGDASSTPWTATPSRRTTSSSPIRKATPDLRHTPAFPNYQERRTSTRVTTAVPLTYDYNSVTPEGHSNHLSQTETPKLRNNFSKVLPNYDGFTSEPSLTTQYEFLKTRVTAPHASSVTPPPRATSKGNSAQSPSYGSGQYDRNATQGSGGVQRTPGGFRYSTHNATPLIPNRSPTSYSALVPTAPDTKFSSSGAALTGPGVKYPVSGTAPTAADSQYPSSGPSAKYPVSGTAPTAADSQYPTSGPAAKFSGTGAAATGPSAKYPVSGSAPTAADSQYPSSGPGAKVSGRPTGAAATGPSAKYPADVKFSSSGGAPTGPQFPVSGGGRYAPDATPHVSGGASTGLGFSGGNLFTDVKFSSTGGTSPDNLAVDLHDDHELDFNTVEVRIPDPRRMFFIPDNPAREAEMLNSNNETVFKISLPSGRHHGAMRFKGVRGTEGRRADCPQCHPAFLLPGKCQPCVLIR